MQLENRNSSAIVVCFESRCQEISLHVQFHAAKFETSDGYTQ
jgi:hypothetical protein